MKGSDRIQFLREYFIVHSDQRMKSFHFFLISIGFLITANFAILGSENGNDLIIFSGAFMTSLTMMCLCIVFWKLDGRTSFLIKLAESELARIDNLDEVDSTGGASIIRKEAEMTELERSEDNPILRQWSYRICFNVCFLVFGIFGLFCGLGALIGLFATLQEFF